MELEKNCPKCDRLVTVVEMPGNFAFLQDGGAVTKCKGCGLEFNYNDFNPASDDYPLSHSGAME